MIVNDQLLSSSATLARPAAVGSTSRRHRAHQDHHDARAKGGRAVPADPYERLQAARAAVQALAGRLLQLAQGGDEEALVEASVRLDALPGELRAAELDLARADVEAARATLRGAEASLARARAELEEEAGAPDAAHARLETDEHWVRECRLAAERAERRRDQLSAQRAGAGPEPADERHRTFAKRVAEARAAI